MVAVIITNSKPQKTGNVWLGNTAPVHPIFNSNFNLLLISVIEVWQIQSETRTGRTSGAFSRFFFLLLSCSEEIRGFFRLILRLTPKTTELPAEKAAPFLSPVYCIFPGKPPQRTNANVISSLLSLNSPHQAREMFKKKKSL